MRATSFDTHQYRLTGGRRYAAERHQQRRRRGGAEGAAADPATPAPHAVMPGIGTGGCGGGCVQSSDAGSRLGIANACSQVTAPPE